MAPRRFSFWMSPMEHRFIRFGDDLFRGWFTPAGRVLTLASLTSALLLVSGLEPVLLFLCASVTATLLTAAALGAAFRPGAVAVRHLSAFPSAGDVLRYRVTVTNPTRRTLRSLSVEERGLPAELRPVGESEVIDALEPGESRDVWLQLRCLNRGAYALTRLSVSSAFPSGLCKWARRQRAQDRLLVFPAFAPMEGFEVPASRNPQPGGIAIAAQVGDSTEFLGTREYAQGDPPSRIHWASTARTGRLIVKEFQEEYFVRLALVLDVEAKSRAAEERLERALSQAAAIADVLARSEYIVDLFAAGPDIFHFQAGRALAHFDNILEILACLEAGHTLDFAKLEAQLLPEADRLSAVVLVLMGWDEPRAALVRKLRAHGVAVRVLSLDPAQRPVGLEPGEEVAR
jgi:uncharacterized protein (DUF58 family)